MKIIKKKNYIQTYGPYSPYIKIDNFLFLSGQIPINKNTGEIPKSLKNQTILTLKNILFCLKKENLHIKNIFKITIFTTKLNQLDEINIAYIKFFKKYTNIYPVRSCIGVSILPKNVFIEIEATAYYKEV